jgi:hypothetical protein
VLAFLFLHVPATNARRRPTWGAAGWGMILTELGLHFTKDGDRRRCVERPELVMLPGGRCLVDGQGFDSLAGALQRSPTAVTHTQVRQRGAASWLRASAGLARRSGTRWLRP